MYGAARLAEGDKDSGLGGNSRGRGRANTGCVGRERRLRHVLTFGGVEGICTMSGWEVEIRFEIGVEFIFVLMLRVVQS